MHFSFQVYKLAVMVDRIGSLNGERSQSNLIISLSLVPFKVCYYLENCRKINARSVSCNLEVVLFK